MTLAARSRPLCRFPILTAGRRKLGASMIPLDEFPTIAAAQAMSEK